MNEDEVIAQLRDIHLPAELERMVTTGFAGWPFLVLAVIVFVILTVRFWKRSQWRWRARAELSRIRTIEDPSKQWGMLLKFAVGLSDRSGRPITLPPTAFMQPEVLSDDQKSEFIAFLNAELER